jgi:hypothetical protein
MPSSITAPASHSKSSSDTHGQRLLYSRAETAYQLSTSLRNIAYRIAAGTLRIQRQGGRVLISHAELLRQARIDDNTPVVPEQLGGKPVAAEGVRGTSRAA